MNKLLRIYTFVLSISMSVYLSAQSVSSLEITPDAHSMGMASASVALGGNAFSVFKNTAAVSFSEKRASAAGTYVNWIGDNEMYAVGTYLQLDKKHAIALGARYFNVEKVFVSQDGLEGKNIHPYDMAIDLGYAYRLHELISISANARYINSKIGEGEGHKKGNAFSFDLGAHFRKDGYSAGVTFSGLGTTIDYGFGSNKLPARLIFGGAYSFTPFALHRFQASIEGEYRFIPSGNEHFGGGAGLEYTYRDLLSLRGGYRLGDKNKSQGNYGVIGCGVNLKFFFADFAYTLAKYDSLVRDVWQISAGFKF